MAPIFFAHSVCSVAETKRPSEITGFPCRVDFSATMQEWDGFGYNYVEASRTRDFDNHPEDHGGFSYLSEEQKAEIIQLVFAREGLGVELIKIFLDPFHQADPEGPFDHERSTSNMMEFVLRGQELAISEGNRIDYITTLYGPPAWASIQPILSGRDMDPERKEDLAEYMIDWVRYLKTKNVEPKYLSFHNEGEDFYRWDFEDGTQRLPQFDYNMYWTPKMVSSFIPFLSDKLARAGLSEVGVTNGEPSNWTRFYNWGYAHALADDPQALDSLALLTTHGFVNGDMSRMSFGTANSSTTRLLTDKKPGLKTWVTSFSWGNLDTHFARVMHEQIYHANVNALIPWAGIQAPPTWKSSNATTAIAVDPEGSYEVTAGYHMYRQFTQAGKRGMKVAQAFAANPKGFIAAFAGGDTGHPDAFVVISDITTWKLPFQIEVAGSEYREFRAFRSSNDGNEAGMDLGVFRVNDGAIQYDPPTGTVTTFIGIN